MFSPKEITRSIVIIILWLIVIAVMIMWLTGCEGTRSTKDDIGRVTIDADCEENTLNVDFNLEQSSDRKEIEVNTP